MSIPTSLSSPSFLDFHSLSQQSHDSHLYDGNHSSTFVAQTSLYPGYLMFLRTWVSYKPLKSHIVETTYHLSSLNLLYIKCFQSLWMASLVIQARRLCFYSDSPSSSPLPIKSQLFNSCRFYLTNIIRISGHFSSFNSYGHHISLVHRHMVPILSVLSQPHLPTSIYWLPILFPDPDEQK